MSATKDWMAEPYDDDNANWSVRGEGFSTVEGEGYVPKRVALLMAAAPRMEEALRVALHAMRAVDLMSQREAREYIEEAIAKAEGRK